MAHRAFELQKEIMAMQEMEVVHRVNHFRMTLDILEKNALELCQAIGYFEDVSSGIDAYSIENRDVFRQHQVEFCRALYNYVCIVKSMVDHTRVLHTKYYKKENLFPDYQKQVDAVFANNTEATFLQDLRNYIVHYRTPVIKNRLSSRQGEGLKARVLLGTEELLEYDGWKASSKKYLANSGDDVEISRICMEYMKLVGEFYDWFFVTLNEIHKQELDILNQKASEHNQAFMQEAPIFIDSSIAIYKEVKHKPEEIFLQLVEPERYREIMSMEEPPERLREFISVVESLCDIGVERKETIEEIFLQHYGD